MREEGERFGEEASERGGAVGGALCWDGESVTERRKGGIQGGREGEDWHWE